MILLVLQTVLLPAAGFALFRLWRAAAPSWVVAAGFLSRAIAGQLLFWISWAHLPIGTSLQLGNGLWMFAQDARYYSGAAGWAAMRGPAAILFFDRTEPSVTYVQTLAVAMSLFGTATSVAVLLNLFCYLGTVAILVRWAKNEPRAQRAVALVIAGVSLAPSFILWSLQPLKDTLFQFLFVAFVALCAWWQRSFLARGGWPARAGIAALMAGVLYTLSGIRWYVGFVLLLAAAVFFVLVIIRSPERKSFAAAAAVVTLIVFSRVFLWSAEPYLPPQLTAALRPTTTLRSAQSAPASILTQMEMTRQAFDRQPAATMIHSTAPVPPRESPRPAARGEGGPARSAGPGEGPIRAALNTYIAKQYPRFIVSNVAIESTSPTTATLRGQWHRSGDLSVSNGTFVAQMRSIRPGAWSVENVTGVVLATELTPRGERSARIARLVSGLAAIVFPWRIGEWLGLFHIGGGRGLMWFTEIDTLIFDFALVCALLALAVRSSVPWRNPLTWLVLAMTLLLAAPLAYSISNFGTLFRLREIVFLGLLLTPLAVATAPMRRAEA